MTNERYKLKVEPIYKAYGDHVSYQLEILLSLVDKIDGYYFDNFALLKLVDSKEEYLSCVEMSNFNLRLYFIDKNLPNPKSKSLSYYFNKNYHAIISDSHVGFKWHDTPIEIYYDALTFDKENGLDVDTEKFVEIYKLRAKAFESEVYQRHKDIIELINLLFRNTPITEKFMKEMFPIKQGRVVMPEKRANLEYYIKFM